MVPLPMADISAPPRCVCVCRTSPTSFGISRGKKKYGRAHRATRLAATRNPSHQAPTQRGSLLESCTSAATREERGFSPVLGQGRYPRAPKGGPSQPQHPSPQGGGSQPRDHLFWGLSSVCPDHPTTKSHFIVSSPFHCCPQGIQGAPLDGDSWHRDVLDAHCAPLAGTGQRSPRGLQAPLLLKLCQDTLPHLC